MSNDLSIEKIVAESLLERVEAQRAAGCRLVQICATALPGELELTYSFDRGGALTSLRIFLPIEGPKVPSINNIFPCAFLYENELHDLFGIQVDGLAIDFHGNLYNTAVKYPFAAMTAPKAKAAPSGG